MTNQNDAPQTFEEAKAQLLKEVINAFELIDDPAQLFYLSVLVQQARLGKINEISPYPEEEQLAQSKNGPDNLAAHPW